MNIQLTKDDLAKIERWAIAYSESAPHGICYWDLHGNDSLTYRKICKALNLKPRIEGEAEKKEKEAEA